MKKTVRVKKKTIAKKASRTKISTKVEKAEKRDYITIFNSHGKEVEKFSLDKTIFDGEVNKGVLHAAVRMYNARRRQGNASTKTRGDVSGGGKKPFRQKGTVRARAGSTRSPLWRHGGAIFGPHPRDYHYDIPKKVKRLAFLSMINSRSCLIDRRK